MRFKSITRAATVIALLFFGFQSIALPSHATAHSVSQAIFQATPDHQILESDCDLCGFAAHQAIHIDSNLSFEAVSPNTILSEIGYRFGPTRFSPLPPPVRGPPRV